MKTKKRIAVVTDAMSKDFYFSAWLRYYSKQFDDENIFIIVYRGSDITSEHVGGANLIFIDHEYNDDLRLNVIQSTIEDILKRYDYVVRADTDEFIVIDPDRYSSLLDFLTTCSAPHVTAYGFDIIQFCDEPPLNFSLPLLSQRRHAFALTALNKTCVVSTPVKWNRGFHRCSEPPFFQDLFILHAKRMDIGLQKRWNTIMCSKSPNDPFIARYYGDQDNKIDSFHRLRSTMPTLSGENVMMRTDFNSAFIAKVRLSESGIYDGPYEIEPVNIEIPLRFCNII